MLKKMRRKFILSAMTAVFTIVFILSALVNVSYFQITARQLDMTLHGIYESERLREDPFKSGQFRGRGPFNEPMPEEPYMTRYFAVSFDGSGEVTHTSRDYIASISDDEAAEYARAVLARGSSSGYYKGYRYLVERGEETSTAVFLNAVKEVALQKVLLTGCITVSLLCMLLAFGIIVVLSRRAVDPYMRNIERQKRFITDASHEIKTPLTAIAASADVLAMEQEGNEWVETIQQQVQRLSKLVGSLVALSRLDEEQPLPEQADFSLSDVIWEIAEPVNSLAAAKGLRFSQQIEDGLTVHGDRNSMGQLVSILLENALKYTSPGGEIRLTAARAHRDIIMEVYNTCHLEDTAHLDRLFDRFYRPDESRSSGTGGNGIGLSIARAIAEAHRGSITARSESGEDITFRVKLRAV